jgi:peptidoglycan/LPS O-acetylase OafA/YrhL
VFIIYCLIGFGFMGQWWLWLVVYGCTAVVAAISWLIVERPALRLKKQTWSGRVAGVRVGALPGMRGIDRPKTLTQD